MRLTRHRHSKRQYRGDHRQLGWVVLAEFEAADTMDFVPLNSGVRPKLQEPEFKEDKALRDAYLRGFVLDA